ncbi:HCP-like protein [Lentinula raphanica]|uniref:HCP-like protein n=1 Tax=Lentinula raphanica TaxID=153919 RepID=A0AA38UFN9_9AGAR|nr:HCP-like protein [Lentinula raphanica]KAJ3840072.1 HCP-like protein [Lentinula raphanica]
MAPSPLRTSQSHPEITLSRRPPSFRPDSPASLYSDAYSFYQLDSASPSPSGTQFKLDSPGGSSGADSRSNQTSTRSHTPTSTNHTAGRPPVVVIDPPQESKSKAEHYLQLGIKHHEANRLQESALCFEKSAKEGGGCGVGMLMWGLTLRHGWGCRKDEKGGFTWVRKAAEGAVADLERARRSGGSSDLEERGMVKAELVLAIYEVGQCFFHGWGVAKDQKMGVSYYRVAARLGDADAQGDLGFCLANGKGCKKDRKEAAKWYRAAVAQGYSDVGLAWIHKEKFQ